MQSDEKNDFDKLLESTKISSDAEKANAEKADILKLKTQFLSLEPDVRKCIIEIQREYMKKGKEVTKKKDPSTVIELINTASKLQAKVFEMNGIGKVFKNPIYDVIRILKTPLSNECCKLAFYMMTEYSQEKKSAAEDIKKYLDQNEPALEISKEIFQEILKANYKENLDGDFASFKRQYITLMSHEPPLEKLAQLMLFYRQSLLAIQKKQFSHNKEIRKLADSLIEKMSSVNKHNIKSIAYSIAELNKRYLQHFNASEKYFEDITQNYPQFIKFIQKQMLVLGGGMSDAKRKELIKNLSLLQTQLDHFNDYMGCEITNSAIAEIGGTANKTQFSTQYQDAIDNNSMGLVASSWMSKRAFQMDEKFGGHRAEYNAIAVPVPKQAANNYNLLYEICKDGLINHGISDIKKLNNYIKTFDKSAKYTDLDSSLQEVCKQMTDINKMLDIITINSNDPNRIYEIMKLLSYENLPNKFRIKAIETLESKFKQQTGSNIVEILAAYKKVFNLHPLKRYHTGDLQVEYLGCIETIAKLKDATAKQQLIAIMEQKIYALSNLDLEQYPMLASIRSLEQSFSLLDKEQPLCTKEQKSALVDILRAALDMQNMQMLLDSVEGSHEEKKLILDLRDQFLQLAPEVRNFIINIKHSQYENSKLKESKKNVQVTIDLIKTATELETKTVKESESRKLLNSPIEDVLSALKTPLSDECCSLALYMILEYSKEKKSAEEQIKKYLEKKDNNETIPQKSLRELLECNYVINIHKGALELEKRYKECIKQDSFNEIASLMLLESKALLAIYKKQLSHDPKIADITNGLFEAIKSLNKNNVKKIAYNIATLNSANLKKSYQGETYIDNVNKNYNIILTFIQSAILLHNIGLKDNERDELITNLKLLENQLYQISDYVGGQLINIVISTIGQQIPAAQPDPYQQVSDNNNMGLISAISINLKINRINETNIGSTQGSVIAELLPKQAAHNYHLLYLICQDGLINAKITNAGMLNEHVQSFNSNADYNQLPEQLKQCCDKMLSINSLIHSSNNDTPELINKIINLLNDKDIPNKFIVATINTLKEKFKADHELTSILEVYKEILGLPYSQADNTEHLFTAYSDCIEKIFTVNNKEEKQKLITLMNQQINSLSALDLQTHPLIASIKTEKDMRVQNKQQQLCTETQKQQLIQRIQQKLSESNKSKDIISVGAALQQQSQTSDGTQNMTERKFYGTSFGIQRAHKPADKQKIDKISILVGFINYMVQVDKQDWGSNEMVRDMNKLHDAVTSIKEKADKYKNNQGANVIVSIAGDIEKLCKLHKQLSNGTAKNKTAITQEINKINDKIAKAIDKVKISKKLPDMEKKPSRPMDDAPPLPPATPKLSSRN